MKPLHYGFGAVQILESIPNALDGKFCPKKYTLRLFRDSIRHHKSPVLGEALGIFAQTVVNEIVDASAIQIFKAQHGSISEDSMQTW